MRSYITGRGWVETLQYLIIITTLRRKINGGHLVRNKVLIAKHTASLRLLYIVGGNQARLDARSEFKISQRSPKGGVKLVVRLSVESTF